MPFKFFRPWEDGVKDSTHKTTDQRHGSQAPETRTPLFVNSCLSHLPEVCNILSEATPERLQAEEETACLSSAKKSTEASTSGISKLEPNLPMAEKILQIISLPIQDLSEFSVSSVNPRGASRCVTDPSQPAKEADSHSLDAAEKTLQDKDFASTSFYATNIGRLEPFATIQHPPSMINPTPTDVMQKFSTQCAAVKSFNGVDDSNTCDSLLPLNAVSLENDFHVNDVHDMAADSRNNNDVTAKRTSDVAFNCREAPSEQDNEVPSKRHSNDPGNVRPKTSKCKECEKCFSHTRSLQGHICIHTPSTSFMCTTSKKTSKQMKSLNHIRWKPLKCRCCEKVLSKLSDLKKHERTHTRSKPFKCRMCEKTFSQSSSIPTHERIHTKSKPFKCKICEKTFSKSSNLQRHERTHTGSKPFKCRICEKIFSRSDNLQTHERTHTGSKPFKCTICKKTFSKSSTLQTHERTHTGSKPFKCRICEKTFSQSSTLQRHERTHTGSKPFKCSVCEKTFAHSGNLLRHKRIHTNEGF